MSQALSAVPSSAAVLQPSLADTGYWLPGNMLDRLPAELLVNIVCRVGEKPEHVLRACRATWTLGNDSKALLQWLMHTFGQTGAVFTFISLRCVVRWPEERILFSIRQLFNQGCTVSDDTQAGCVLYWASKRGMARVLDLLLTHVKPGGWLNNLLKSASAQGQEDCVRVLISKGADPNVDGGRPLKAATEAGSVGCVRALLDGGADIHAAADCALRLCAAAGSPAHVKIMEVLLDRGADVHAKGDEALGLAVERSNAEAVSLLLHYGANASARQVLETAAATGSAKIVRLLLAHGALANADGGRPLRAAAEAGSVEVVRQLLDAGALSAGCSGGAGSSGPAGPRRSLGQRPPMSSAAAARQSGSGRPGLARPSLDAARAGRTPAAGIPFRAVAPGEPSGFRPNSWHSGIYAPHATVSHPAPVPTYAPNPYIAPPPQSNTSIDSMSDMSGQFATETAGPSTNCRDSMTGGHDNTGHTTHTVPAETAGCELGPECDGYWEDEMVGEFEFEDEGDSRPDAGEEALCAALCAGEAEVVRVLMERGARADLQALRCWRQWHRYPGVMAVLQGHRPLGEAPTCLLQTPQPEPRAAAQLAPLSAAPAGPSAGHWTEQVPPLSRWSIDAQSSAAAAAASGGGGRLCQSHSWRYLRSVGSDPNLRITEQAALQQLLREALVSAAAEGSEAGVRLFLTWGAPTAADADVAIAALRVHTAIADMSLAANPAGPSSSAPTHQMPSDQAACRMSNAQGAVLGAFTAECLSNALVAAAAANRPVIVRQLLEHKSDAAWSQAVLHPAALHAAVSDGYAEVARSLLAAGAATVTLGAAPAASPDPAQTPPRPPMRPRNGSSPGYPRPREPQTMESPLKGGVGSAASARFPPPPPPLSDQSWGTVVLCAAAACKAGRKPAAALTFLLLSHGFATCARDALKLVACGRVPTWREEAAAEVLSAAFTS